MVGKRGIEKMDPSEQLNKIVCETPCCGDFLRAFTTIPHWKR